MLRSRASTMTAERKLPSADRKYEGAPLRFRLLRQLDAQTVGVPLPLQVGCTAEKADPAGLGDAWIPNDDLASALAIMLRVPPAARIRCVAMMSYWTACLGGRSWGSTHAKRSGAGCCGPFALWVRCCCCTSGSWGGSRRRTPNPSRPAERGRSIAPARPPDAAPQPQARPRAPPRPRCDPRPSTTHLRRSGTRCR